MTSKAKLELVREPWITTPVAYSLRFKGYGAWAIFTINDATGEFSIQSDWGNYSYRWNTDALGDKDLTDFLCQCEPNYIVRKFSQENKHDLKPVTDLDETRRVVRESILEQRRIREIEKDDARALYELVNDWVDANCVVDECPPDLWDFLNEPWEFIREKHSERWRFLQDELLPFFFDWLSKHLEARTPPPE